MIRVFGLTRFGVEMIPTVGDRIPPRVTIKDGRIKFEESTDNIDRPINKLSRVLRLNATTFVPCLESFGDAEVKASLYEGDGPLRIEQGDLTVLSVQLR